MGVTATPVAVLMASEDEDLCHAYYHGGWVAPNAMPG
jgi:hypothetical protein